jgi:signal transduction histidine kinase
MALEGLAKELPPEHRSALRLREIIEMAELTLRDIRKVAADTRSGGFSATQSLRKGLRLQVERYRRFFGIDIDVSCPDAPRLPRSTAIVAFRIVSEALSNILRHTKSRKVTVMLRVMQPNVVLEIRNQIGPGEDPPYFEPRSIRERVRERGGTLEVVPNDRGCTIVRATFPVLWGARTI